MAAKYVNKFMKYKKIHSFIVAILVYLILVRVFGMDFFTIETIKTYKNIELIPKDYDEIFGVLFLSVFKCIFILYLLYKVYSKDFVVLAIVFLNTIMVCLICNSVLRLYKDIGEAISVLAIYLQKYSVVYIYSYIFQKFKFGKEYIVGANVKNSIHSGLLTTIFLHCIFSLIISLVESFMLIALV